MAPGFAAVTDDDGVLVRSADVNGFTLSELQFPSAYVQGAFEPEFPYLALVLDGAAREVVPGPDDAARQVVRVHDAGRRDARGALRAERRAHRDREDPDLDARLPTLDGLAELDARELCWLAWRLAAELRASDTAAPLAAEGLALELLAAASRERRPRQANEKAAGLAGRRRGASPRTGSRTRRPG